MDVEEIKKELETDDKNGLTQHQANERLLKYGKNALKEKKLRSLLRLLRNCLNLLQK